MSAASSRRPSFRTAEYWAALEAIAGDLINETAPHTQRLPVDARRTLQRLSSRGFGPLSLFDLCALLVLATPRASAASPDAGARVPSMPLPTEPMATAPAAGPIAELKRGPVTVAAHPTERHIQHLRELEEGVAEARLISSEHPRARSAVRRALMARGRTVQDATAVYGIVCELIAHAPRATS
ncbi:hypothetical protein [Streptomyces sp. NPDC050988]|uniref:hypothetical protein n=1 Tax=Streptomyces sp. NPDC050988 TaxID=3365637 RepID=UPI0037A72F41